MTPLLHDVFCGFTFQDLSHLLLKVLKLKRSQKSEGSQVKGHHRWNGLLEQGRSVQQGPVSSQADNEVDLVRQVVLLLIERHQLVAHLKKVFFF